MRLRYDARDSSPARRLALALLLAALTAWIAVTRAGPPAALGLDAPPDVGSAARAEEVLERLARGLGPHPVGSPDNALLRERIAAELVRLGLEPRVQSAFVQSNSGAASARGAARTTGAIVHNVVARMSGSLGLASPREAILCLAHYDSVGAGPGIADDLAGVAAWLEVARAIGATADRTRRDLVFLFSDGEEDGLLGAEAFAKEHAWADDVGVVVNLEARGTRGASRMFETGADNDWVVAAFARAATRPSANSLSTEVYRRMPNDTDYSVFRRRGVPGLNFAWIGGVAQYHTPLDDLAHLDRRSLQHHVTNALDAVRGLDRAEFRSSAGRPGDSVFADVLSLGVVGARVGFVRGLALAALILAAFGCARAVRRGVTTVPRVVGGAAGALLTAAFALAAAHGASAAMELVAGVERPWRAHPTAAVAACAGAALAGAALAGPLVARLARELGAFHGANLVLVVLFLASALFVPGASYLLLPSCALSAALAAVVRLDGHAAARAGRIAAVAACVSVVLAAPLAAALTDAFGMAPPAVPGPSLGLAIGAAMLVPLLHLAPSFAGGWRFMGAVAALAGACAVVAGLFAARFVPATSEEAPGHLVVAYAADHDTGEAAWHLTALGDPIPAEMLAAAPFGDPAPPFPGSSLRVASAPAPPGLASFPELDELRWFGAGGRSFSLVLRSTAEGHELELACEGLASLTVEGDDAAADGIRLAGTPERGWRISGRLAPDAAAARLRVSERVLRLPSGSAVAAARPPDRVPVHRGDHCRLARTFALAPPGAE